MKKETFISFEQMKILKRIFKYLYNQAFTDQMTGLKNRNAYEERVKYLRSNPSQLKNLRVMMLDINGMKFINDNYGHTPGDEAIKIVGMCMAEAFGDKEFCARYGGDEFVGLFYSDITENIAKLNRSLKMKGYSVEYPLSVSIGVAEFDETKDNGIDSLINRCDQLMYMKKKARAAEHCYYNPHSGDNFIPAI